MLARDFVGDRPREVAGDERRDGLADLVFLLGKAAAERECIWKALEPRVFPDRELPVIERVDERRLSHQDRGDVERVHPYPRVLHRAVRSLELHERPAPLEARDLLLPRARNRRWLVIGDVVDGSGIRQVRKRVLHGHDAITGFFDEIGIAPGFALQVVACFDIHMNIIRIEWHPLELVVGGDLVGLLEFQIADEQARSLRRRPRPLGTDHVEVYFAVADAFQLVGYVASKRPVTDGGDVLDDEPDFWIQVTYPVDGLDRERSGGIVQPVPCVVDPARIRVGKPLAWWRCQHDVGALAEPSNEIGAEHLGDVLVPHARRDVRFIALARHLVDVDAAERSKACVLEAGAEPAASAEQVAIGEVFHGSNMPRLMIEDIMFCQIDHNVLPYDKMIFQACFALQSQKFM